MVKRIGGKYRLTSFDKAIDSIMTMMSADKKELPLEECQKITDNLIDNREIKDILISNGIGITR
jgi:hypothetical protein